jgi:hypothetical protein
MAPGRGGGQLPQQTDAIGRRPLHFRQNEPNFEGDEGRGAPLARLIVSSSSCYSVALEPSPDGITTRVGIWPAMHFRTGSAGHRRDGGVATLQDPDRSPGSRTRRAAPSPAEGGRRKNTLALLTGPFAPEGMLFGMMLSRRYPRAALTSG